MLRVEDLPFHPFTRHHLSLSFTLFLSLHFALSLSISTQIGVEDYRHRLAPATHRWIRGKRLSGRKEKIARERVRGFALQACVFKLIFFK